MTRRCRTPTPGRLTNGTFSLAQPLQVTLSKSTWNAPVSNDTVTVSFKQAIGANEALRTGAYSKTLTFTLSTTQSVETNPRGSSFTRRTPPLRS